MKRGFRLEAPSAQLTKLPFVQLSSTCSSTKHDVEALVRDTFFVLCRDLPGT